MEVSADGGHDWHAATLDVESLGPWAWRRWSWTWVPDEPGDHELWCRARDAAGNEQPVDQAWSLKGYANDAVHRLPVTVRDG